MKGSSLSRRQLEEVLKGSLEEAVAQVGEDARAILGLQFVGGLDGARIGQRLGVHRITVVRRQKAAREALRAAWLSALRAQVGAEAEALLDERFDQELSLSLPRLLAPPR